MAMGAVSYINFTESFNLTLITAVDFGNFDHNLHWHG